MVGCPRPRLEVYTPCVRTPLLLIALAAAGCTRVAHTFDEVEEWPLFDAAQQVPPAPDPTAVRIMTWNLKFGGARVDFFFDGWGERVHMSEAEVEGNIDAIIALIDELDPDILMAQEVDVNSKRSAYVDQADAILQRTAFNHMGWVPNWFVDYIPEEGLGHVEAGQAVFSKYPIRTNTRVDLPQSEDSSFVVNYFWLHRAIQINEIDLGAAGTITIVNNHPTAYSLDGTKAIHMAEIERRSKAAEGVVVTGGDLNVIPPGSARTEDFADEADTNTTGVTTVTYSDADMASLEPFYEAFTPLLSLEDYGTTEEEQEAWYTHTVTDRVFWTQKLDYLFTTESWSGGWHLQQPGDGPPPGITADPLLLSDHAPLLGDLVLP